ncbi:MAG: hypothetical protein JKY96_02010 [Phycisphaerales bacterium]|nr:hypothetical protein [Phycisphaerales bacterium]
MPEPTIPSIEHPHNHRDLVAVLGILGVVVVSVVGFASIGAGGPVDGRVAVALAEVVFSGWMPAVYLLGALGFGGLFGRLGPAVKSNHPLQAALGVAVTLSITHLLGIAGLLNFTTAWTATAIGILLWVYTLAKNPISIRFASDRVSWILLGVLAIGVGLMIVAASSPPGALWDSEFGAYDSLSYHLQLPKEWIASAQIWPVEHNVYSYHPGYIESGYTHMALLGNRPMTLQGAQYFSLLLVLIGAWNCSRAASQWCGSGSWAAAGPLAACMVVLTPWIMLVGTMSYNESGVIALGAGALVVASCQDIKPSIRGLLCGVLVAAACSC